MTKEFKGKLLGVRVTKRKDDTPLVSFMVHDDGLWHDQKDFKFSAEWFNEFMEQMTKAKAYMSQSKKGRKLFEK